MSSLTPLEIQVKNHALLSSIGFLILLPVGSLTARYTRTFTSKWFTSHATIQFLTSPIIFAGWALGYRTAQDFRLPHFHFSPHQKMGLALLVMYLVQLVLGVFIHFVKVGPGPSSNEGWRRSAQNYFHAVLGLAILALAASQVHYGLYTEWPLLFGNVHPVVESAKHAWLALVVVFWALYALGLVFLPRQFRQERKASLSVKEGDHIPLNEESRRRNEVEDGSRA